MTDDDSLVDDDPHRLLPAERSHGIILPGAEARAESQSQSLPGEVVIKTFEHSGPVPSAPWLKEVEQICPGATEMILRDYTEQREHDREMERESLEFDQRGFEAFARYQNTRLLIAGGLATLIAIAGIVLIATGYSVWGLIMLIAEITGLVAVFFGRRPQAAAPDASEEKEPAS